MRWGKPGATTRDMKEPTIDRRLGREAFGADPGGYHAARPPYPDWVFEILCERCDLAHGAATFEIGAGTGTATRQLLDLGAKPLVAVEPDSRLATFLRETVQDEALTVVSSTFEDAALDEAGFDLGVSATAFHWLDEDFALAKVAKLLRPNGWWAMVWNVFGDDSRPDSFHEATKALLNGPSSPSAGVRNIPFALDVEARVAALERTRSFDAVEHRTGAWPLVLDTDQTVALYATFSNINIRPDRDAVLAELGRIARDEFHGHVTRNMTTSLYIARRRP
jgi:SAM-dependent methyltransferase